MAIVTLTGQTMNVDIEGFDKLWSLKSGLQIPLQHVRGATADPGIASERRGWRGPGTYVPGVITAGTFHQDGDLVFWDVRDPTKAIVIELDDERYRRLVIEVEDPRAAVAAIEQALHSAH